MHFTQPSFSISIKPQDGNDFQPLSIWTGFETRVLMIKFAFKAIQVRTAVLLFVRAQECICSNNFGKGQVGL